MTSIDKGQVSNEMIVVSIMLMRFNDDDDFIKLPAASILQAFQYRVPAGTGCAE